MKEFNIKITDDGDIYINDKICGFACDMDKNDHETDLDKKAILALANEMGYEAQFLFEEMADRLDEMLDEIDEEEHGMTNEQKRWNALPNFDNETVKIWLDALLESTNKMHIEELTTEEIKAEIEETKGSIENFSIWGDKHSILDCEEYIEVLEEMLNNKEEN